MYLIAPNGQALYVNTYDHNKRDYITSVDENGRDFAYSYERREQLEQVSTPEGDISGSMIMTEQETVQHVEPSSVVWNMTVEK